MTAMGNKVLATRTVSRPPSTVGGYPLMPLRPYEAAMTPPPSHGPRGGTDSPGVGTGVSDTLTGMGQK